MNNPIKRVIIYLLKKNLKKNWVQKEKLKFEKKTNQRNQWFIVERDQCTHSGVSFDESDDDDDVCLLDRNFDIRRMDLSSVIANGYFQDIWICRKDFHSSVYDCDDGDDKMVRNCLGLMDMAERRPVGYSSLDLVCSECNDFVSAILTPSKYNCCLSLCRSMFVDRNSCGSNQFPFLLKYSH